jgi:hypothetical protein
MFHYKLLDKITIIIYLIKWSTFILVLCLKPFSLGHLSNSLYYFTFFPSWPLQIILEQIILTKLQEITQMYKIHDF